MSSRGDTRGQGTPRLEGVRLSVVLLGHSGQKQAGEEPNSSCCKNADAAPPLPRCHGDRAAVGSAAARGAGAPESPFRRGCGGLEERPAPSCPGRRLTPKPLVQEKTPVLPTVSAFLRASPTGALAPTLPRARPHTHPIT